MNTIHSTERIDEIEPYFQSPKRLDSIVTTLFWVIAFFSLLIPYFNDPNIESQSLIKAAFIVLVITHFFCNLVLSLYLIPVAERKRRRQLLSNAFGTPLIQEKTSLYYNNSFEPSIQKMGANIMENCLFSKEIATRMLFKARWIIGIYMFLWLALFTVRHNDLDLMLWITQVVFSSAVVMRWVQLEFLRYRHDHTYEMLYNLFLNGNLENSKSTATILDAFATYESTKASAGLVLSTEIFQSINEEYTGKWQNIRSLLKMDI